MAIRQEGGEYQSIFEDEYWTIDLSNTAADVHRQVRAWSFMPPVGEFGPFLERDGHRIKVKSTSLTELEGAERARVRRRPALDRRERAGLMPRPTIWKPRYATRRMRERAWTRADLERERAARAAPAAPSLLARLLRVLR